MTSWSAGRSERKGGPERPPGGGRSGYTDPEPAVRRNPTPALASAQVEAVARRAQRGSVTRLPDQKTVYGKTAQLNAAAMPILDPKQHAPSDKITLQVRAPRNAWTTRAAG